MSSLTTFALYGLDEYLETVRTLWTLDTTIYCVSIKNVDVEISRHFRRDFDAFYDVELTSKIGL